jgi:hypothetical protein
LYGRFRNGRGETGAHCASSCSNGHDARAKAAGN